MFRTVGCLRRIVGLTKHGVTLTNKYNVSNARCKRYRDWNFKLHLAYLGLIKNSCQFQISCSNSKRG